MTKTEQNLINRIKELNNEGYSLLEMSFELNMNTQKISQIMKENNIEKYTKKKSKFSKIEELKIVRLYTEEKLKVSDIQKRFNTSSDTIRNILKKYKALGE